MVGLRTELKINIVSIMSDDIVIGGVLPIGDDKLVDEFDPDAIESDIFLDDPLDDDLAVVDAPLGALDDDDVLEDI